MSLISSLLSNLPCKWLVKHRFILHMSIHFSCNFVEIFIEMIDCVSNSIIFFVKSAQFLILCIIHFFNERSYISVSMNASSDINTLDKIRADKGINDLKNYFKKLLEKNPEKAFELLNDDNLSYGTLFLLRDIIENSSLVSQLRNRNKAALQITDEILEDNSNTIFEEHRPTKYISSSKSALKWILNTGYMDDGLDNSFDRVIDVTAALLTKVYKDTTCLSVIVDLIFKRNEKGTLIHDLVWALFESQDPTCLALIGNRLQSNSNKEYELCCKLLSFIPNVNIVNNANKEKQYLSFLRWFEENSMFLRYTGESFQQTSSPIPFVIDLEAKYLCRAVKYDSTENIQSLSQNEVYLLNRFRKLDYNTKILLADFSYKVRQSNINWWKAWINYSIEEQLQFAHNGMSWYYD